MTLPLFSACAQKRKSQGHEQGRNSHSDHGRKALINSCGHGHDFSQARRHIALAAVILCEAHQLAISSDGTRVAVACGRGSGLRAQRLEFRVQVFKATVALNTKTTMITVHKNNDDNNNN